MSEEEKSSPGEERGGSQHHFKKTLVKEARSMGIIFLGFLILFQIIFYRENVMVTLRTVFSLFLLFILPGFYFMYLWQEKIEFLERFIIGFIVGLSLYGILSYYLGVLEIHLQWYAYIISAIVLVVDGVIVYWKMRE